MDIVGIYVENHYNRNRKCFIWIRVDNINLGEEGSLTQLMEDLIISETCPLEETASHHVGMCTLWWGCGRGWDVGASVGVGASVCE